MRNLLLLFINILVFSSISFAQIIPATGQFRCQNVPITFVTTGLGFIYSWNFSGAGVDLSTSASSGPTVTCSLPGTLIVSCIVDGVPQTQSIITINTAPPTPNLTYINSSPYCMLSLIHI